MRNIKKARKYFYVESESQLNDLLINAKNNNFIVKVIRENFFPG